ncbi:lithostathine-1-beta-like [Heteronotia binoei]|uniref:lithostathine-1-beta-like n=1 Tax=Heteronotia binoei TaxID=13085 RepID=UPI00292D5957|nr:lithostathine-1-beta-like [Heteronotia binoei]XP_060102034.1 lithostathine-1-beta-like [Heteronotia binoei]
MGLLSCFNLAFLGFLIAGPSPRGVGALSCPSGWLFYQGNCYGLFQDKLTWAEAEIDCQSQGRNGHLTSITSQAEGAVLANLIKASPLDDVNVWIGLHDPQKNGRWRWSNRSLVNYKSWFTGMPDNYKNQEYCTELWRQSGYVGWNDVNCKHERPYICKYEL